MSCTPFTAELVREEAVLRFPYDEDLRLLLRAIPGRRWDPVGRAWCVPLAPEGAQALWSLLDSLPEEPAVSAELAARIRGRRARRRPGTLPVDVVRPDSDWWLSFPTDLASPAAEALMEHPLAREVLPIGRAMLPLDGAAVELLAQARRRWPGVQVSPAAERALSELRRPKAGSEDGAAEGEHSTGNDIEFRRDRSGGHWILVSPAYAERASELAAHIGLRAQRARGGALGLAAREEDAEALRELLVELSCDRVDPRIEVWLERARAWRGTIEVGGPAAAPVFLLLGAPERLPDALRARSVSAPGGVALTLAEDSLEMVQGLHAWMSPAARRCVAALADGRPAPPAVLELSGVHEQPTFVLAPGHDRELLPTFAALSASMPPRGGTSGSEHVRLPAMRVDPFCVPELDGFLADSGTWVSEPALAALQEVREEHARAEGLVALSSASEGELAVAGLGGVLKPFQRAGVSYLLERRRAFLADEQGLGKTIEALAAVQAAAAYPAIVVCPASLKLNWLREIERWLPGRSARSLSGSADRTGGEVSAEITLVNYDILAARLSELSALGPRALILDESHLCKNPAAKRTQAAHRLAAEVPPDGLVLALTGTPVTNRPAELISQLRIIGRLSEFGSGAQFGERFRGPDAHLRLHWHLRARCFVRRLKADVLPQLPSKTRAIVPIELDNEAEYRLAERDLVAWLRSQPLDLRELDARVASALRAERLVRLNALKLLAARGKLAAALRWIHDFCASGERLVVFARHREVQRALAEHFPRALHILGEDSPAQRDRAVHDFQAPDCAQNQLIVCSLEVAGQGLTLTRASNVAFLELDWTPAKHDQAEDRCHRIGQHDAVTAYYLLAAETVDESIATLLERKRAVIGAVTDGREQDEEGVVDALVRELRGAPYRHLRAVA